MGKKSRLKSQPTIQAPQKPSPVQEIFPKVIFAGLLLLLFYPPYFRAMFFTKEQLPTHIFTLILFILWWVVKYQRNDSTFLSTPLDYFVFGFVLIYFLTLPIAINKRGAIQEFLKVTNYFLVYWLASEFSRTKKEATAILNALVFSALGVAILGLGAAAGTWEVHGGYKDGRIFSTIQYPNSLAAYLTGAMFIALGLLHNASLKFKRVYIITAFFLFLTPLLTYSRGGWLILPVFSLLYLLVIPKESRKEAVYTMGTVFIFGTILLPIIGRLYLAERGAFAWLIIFVASLGILGLQYFSTNVVYKIKPLFKIVTVTTIFVLIVTGIFVYSSRTLSLPLRLAHSPAEANSSNLLIEKTELTPETEYTLSMSILAEGTEEAPYAWQVTVIGLNAEGGTATLFNEQGKVTEGWEEKQFTFTTPKDIKQANIRILNHYTDTSVEVKNVVLASPDSSQEISFNWYRLMPSILYNRFFTFTTSTNSVQARFLFSRDAWEIIKDYLLFGLGGHGWKSRYFQYQTASYNSTEVHNHFFQVWVETGTIGFLLFMAVWLSFLYTAYQLYRGQDIEKKRIAAAVTVGVLAVVSHSLYDFNLSLGAIGIFLFAVLGVVRGLNASPCSVTKEQSKPYAGLAITAALVLLVFVSFLQVGHNAHEKGIEYLRRNQLSQAVNVLNKAVNYDRMNPDYRVTLSDAYEGLFIQEQDTAYLKKVDQQLAKAISLDRYHPKYHNRYGTFLVRSGKFDEGLNILNRTIELQPWLVDHYNIYARTSLNVASYLMRQDQPASAHRYIQQALATEARLKAYTEDTRKVALAMGQAHYMLENLEEAEKYLLTSYQIKEDQAVSAMILSLVYESKGDASKAKEYYNKAESLEPASVQFYQELKEI